MEHVNSVGVNSFVDPFTQTFNQLGSQILGYLPSIIGAIIVFAIGVFISALMGKLVSRVLEVIKFNHLFEKIGWTKILEKAEWKVDPSALIGSIVKWILIIIFLFAAVDLLGFKEFSNFLEKVVSWLPNIIAAIIMFILAAVIGNYLSKIGRMWIEGLNLAYGKVVETGIRWFVWLVAIVIILKQIGIESEPLIILYKGLVAFLVIAGGLAFGLGGKDIAAEILREWKNKISEKEQ